MKNVHVIILIYIKGYWNALRYVRCVLGKLLKCFQILALVSNFVYNWDTRSKRQNVNFHKKSFKIIAPIKHVYLSRRVWMLKGTSQLTVPLSLTIDHASYVRSKLVAGVTTPSWASSHHRMSELTSADHPPMLRVLAKIAKNADVVLWSSPPSWKQLFFAKRFGVKSVSMFWLGRCFSLV